MYIYSLNGHSPYPQKFSVETSVKCFKRKDLRNHRVPPSIWHTPDFLSSLGKRHGLEVYGWVEINVDQPPFLVILYRIL